MRMRTSLARLLASIGLLVSIGLLAAIGATAARAQTAHSLDQVPPLLKTPEAKNFYAEQMAGKPAPDGLGVHLPTGLSAQQVTALMPPAAGAKLNVVGAKSLPGQADRYVAVVCTGGDIPTGPDDTPCTRALGDDAAPPLQVTLGVIEMKPGAAPALVARPAQIDGKVNWKDTALPAAPQALDDAADGRIAPDGYEGFDLAPYRIAADQTAFGLRGVWTESYSGGGANYSALYLFAVVDGAVKQILAVPMSAFQDIAGDWHKDGTRDHQIIDAANLLVVTPHSTAGHFDLLLKARAGHGQRTYRWSTTTGSYQPAAK
jgi:hypothetical protein